MGNADEVTERAIYFLINIISQKLRKIFDQYPNKPCRNEDLSAGNSAL